MSARVEVADRGFVTDRGPLAVLVDVLLVAAAVTIDGLAPSLSPELDRSVGGIAALVLAILAALTLFLRRRWPLVPFAAWWVYGLVPLLVAQRAPFVGLLIALATVASRRPPRVALVTAALAVVPLGVSAYGTSLRQPDQMTVATTILLYAIYVLLAAAALGVGRVIGLLRGRLDLQARLHAAELQTTIREERMRLARDLHDIVAHSVSAMILQAAGARSLSDETDVRIRSALRSVELTGADAMKELHRLLGLLRETAATQTPDLAAQPGLANIDQILATTRACGVEVDLQQTGTPRRLDPEVDYTAFRMVQECMANVIKHGGAGARSTVEINWHDDGLDITVRNDEHDAVSASMLSGGYGLRGLTERVQEVGGRFAAGPAEESIFVASMTLPLRLAGSPSAGG